MDKKRWVAALAICPDEIESVEPNTVMATLKNGQKVPVAIYAVDDEMIKTFQPERALQAYNQANGITEEEFHGAD